MSYEFTNEDIDVFKEMGSIGSGNAATALSQMLNKKVIIRPIKTSIVRIEDIPNEVGSSEQVVMAVYLRIMGDLSGDAIYFHPRKEAFKLINILTGNSIIPDEAKEEEISIYKELSNIFTGSYMNAISSMLNVSLIPSVPHYACDMLGSLIDFLIAEMGTQIDKIFLLKTEMNINENEIKGGYLMFFNPDSMTKMMDLVHKKYGI
jgi:chemotaxis protein CheC